MYFIKYGKDYLYDPRVDYSLLTDTKITIEENEISQVEFTIYENHEYYNKLKERDYNNLITVYEDDEDDVLFAGFIVRITSEYNKAKTITCKHFLQVLTESVTRPYSSYKKSLFTHIPHRLDQYFAWLIYQHNEQSSPFKKLSIVVNEGYDIESGDIVFENEGYSDTWAEIKNNILKDRKCHIEFKMFNGIPTISLVKYYTSVNTQAFRYGMNITDIDIDEESKDIATCVIPIGCSLSESPYQYNDGYYQTSDTVPSSYKKYYTGQWQFEEKTDLTYFKKLFEYYEKTEEEQYVRTQDRIPVPGKVYGIFKRAYDEVTFEENERRFESGVTYYEYSENADESQVKLNLQGYPDTTSSSDDFQKKDDFLFSMSAVDKYGFIYKTVENSDIYSKDDLVLYGLNELYGTLSKKITVDVVGYDQHLIDKNLSPIRVGQYVRVISEPHGLDTYMLCRKMEYDIDSPESSEFKLTMEYSEFFGIRDPMIQKLNAEKDRIIV